MATTFGIDLGIDLGTTNSVATVWWRGEPRTLPLQNRIPRELLRSVVLFAPDGTYVGENAQSREALFPELVVRSIKTDMGTSRLRTFQGKDYSPEEISALILREIIDRGRLAYLAMSGEKEAPIGSITVTVPARFNLKAVQSTRRAAEIAGFAGENCRILRESDAAALAYIRGDPNPQTVLVYDLGGGTFDVSVMRFTGTPPSFFEHFGPPGGDPRLGGDVFDQRVFEQMATFVLTHGVRFDLKDLTPPEGVSSRQWSGARLAVLDQARFAKEVICNPSMPEDYAYEVVFPDLLGITVVGTFAISRQQFHELIRDHIDAATAEVRRLLAELKLDRRDIDRIVLAGGSTRIPLVSQSLQEVFGFRPNDTLEPDKAISIGACLYGQILAGVSSRDRETIVPPTYLTVPVGLRVTKYVAGSLADGARRIDARSEFEPILERGFRCPGSRTRTFTTVRDRQSVVRFEVFVQEGGNCNPDNFVSFYELPIPTESRGPRGDPKIDVNFTVESTGSQLTISATDRRTGYAIKNIVRLDDRSQIKLEPREDVSITLDEFGNPKGLEHDLGGNLNAICRGKRILLYSAFVPTGETYTWTDAVKAVGERGFAMDLWLREKNGTIDELDLGPYDELWLVSERTLTITQKLKAKVERFVADGKGLLIWTDNEPYFADGNLLGQALTRSTFSGYYNGDKVLKPSDTLGAGYFIPHALTAGLNNLYEGITISRIHPGPDVTVVARGSDGYPCMAVYDDSRARIVLDTGFTKLYEGKFKRTAGTARYFRNIAFWLLKEARPFTIGSMES